jgi:putative transcriptional regulator
MKIRHDWTRSAAMTDAEIHDAALADPDAQPLTPERLARMKRTPQVRVIRRALGLSQEKFAERFRIPLGTLRDWEQRRKEPDAATRAYLVVIGRNPAAVAEALRPDLCESERPRHCQPSGRQSKNASTTRRLPSMNASATWRSGAISASDTLARTISAKRL